MLQIKAHAGCEGTRPNTAESFRRALALAVDVIEIDVQTTCDHVAVAWHDDMAAGLPIARTSWAALRQGEPALISLEAALDILRDFPGTINLDLKTADYAAVYRTLHTHGVPARTVLTGIEAEAADACRAAIPGASIWLGAPYEPDGIDARAYPAYLERCLRAVQDSGCTDLNIWFGNCSPELVARAHAAGIRVHIWTVDTLSDMRAALAMQADSLTTNQVCRLRHLLAQQEREDGKQ